MRTHRRFETLVLTLQLPMSRIVEDPNSRKSHESYFIQLADWLAFAAHRSKHVDPKGPFSAGLWDQVSALHLAEVNRLTGGPPAIVKYPDVTGCRKKNSPTPGRSRAQTVVERYHSVTKTQQMVRIRDEGHT